MELSGRTAAIEGGMATIPAVFPGPYVLNAQLGLCPANAEGCNARGDCPAGCSAYQDVEFIVPAGEGDFSVNLALIEPIEAAVRPAPVAAPVTDVPPPKRTGSGTAPVTKDAFARWLASHPEWQRDAAIAAGRADGSYLQGWLDA